jgi:protein-S-isoprenylcysteine O-methyltransferase Ste14
VSPPILYTGRERAALWAVAVFGFVAVNGAFLYGSLADPHAMQEALTNPISAAFIAEAFVLMGVFAYLFAKWGVASLSWRWFVLLSLLGSMAFALPVVLLYRAGKRRPD